LAKLKRLADKEDDLVLIPSPVSTEEIVERAKDYSLLTPKQFGTKHKELLFKPIDFTWNGETFQIQYNHCANPYCKWHGLSQEKFRGKLSRYRLSGSGNEKILKCNSDPIEPTKGATFDCNTITLSNWSIAQEIERLTRINSVQDLKPEYQFHKEGCVSENATPFDEPKLFYKRGKSTGKSQRWQCKSCKKFTNVLPDSRKSITYGQQKSDILPLFVKLLLSRVPITRTCEILGIGRGTYYDKLEFIYRRCLEFLERHELKPLQEMQFKEMWLNTDKMTYFLNNVRKKGMGGSHYNEIEERQFPTHVVITADVFSRYVFRSDVSYDWDISLQDIALDTFLLKEDHLSEFAKKHARISKYSHYPMPPSKNDTQTNVEYQIELEQIKRRAKYIDGLHVNSTYTTIAHYWLIKQLVKASEWRFVTDKDNSLMTSLFRVYAKEFRLSNAHHFLCQTDKTKSRKQAREEFVNAKMDLINWGVNAGYNTNSLRKLAFYKLEALFHTHSFHREVVAGFSLYYEYANNPIEHPLATIDRGFRWVDCTTNLSSFEPKDIANLILNVNDNATNNFIQHIRRRVSILERPLTTARGDGKSYIYSNFNPKYAQMALTILRTYYNFCLPYKTRDEVGTPAQRLGIAKKEFNIKDIIYMQ
jgi:transposase-like protein